jgi:hypothetical protein
MRDAPTPGDLLQLAADVAAASGGAALNANDRSAALRLLDALCNDADAAQVTETLTCAGGTTCHFASDGGLGRHSLVCSWIQLCTCATT